MKIAQIVPGFGGTFYCENCLRDLELPRALQKLGHQVCVLPMYLPLSTAGGGPDQPTQSPLFYGAIRVYLEEKLPFLRKAPARLGRFLDAPFLLRLASKLSGSTSSKGLSDMTLSVLKGEKGVHAEELAELVEWLRQCKPDVVHLSNALLMGLAGGIKKALNVPVVCTLQDEDAWIDSMEAGEAQSIWNALKDLASRIDAFLPVSRTYADAMTARLALPTGRVKVVYSGIQSDDYITSPAAPDPPVIGYLSRMCESQGLGVLVDAFLRLKSDPRLKTLKLKVTGGATGKDRRFLRNLHGRLHAAGAAEDVEFLPDFDRASRIRFLGSINVLSVPAVNGEAFGLFILEALASGVPVVQPRTGGFPEIVEITKGGFLYEPNDASTLANELTPLLLSPVTLRRTGARGREIVRQRFDISRMARDTVQVYESCVL